MANEVTVVFTAKSTERILKEGGTASWRLDRNNARQRPYALCTRNAHADWVEGPEEHRSAFLLGKVSDVVPTRDVLEGENADNRYLIRFSEYAKLDMPDVWVKGDRNPVKYTTLEELGVDPSQLTWEAMPEPGVVPYMSMVADDGRPAEDKPLTMAEAKRGLALMFNVPPSAIEITIRG
jgi:hypothetical protein